MSIIAFVLLGLLCLVMTFRYLYMTMLTRWWHEVVIIYILESGEHPLKAEGYAQVWPMHLIMLYGWEWNIARFIVDQEGLVRVLEHFDGPKDKS